MTTSTYTNPGIRQGRDGRVPASTGDFPGVGTLRLYAWAFLLAAIFSRYTAFSTAAIVLGCLITVHLFVSGQRMPWYGKLVIATSAFWLAYGLAIGSVPDLADAEGFISTEGRVLVALVPLAGLSAARTRMAHLKALERVFEVIALLGILAFVAWKLEYSFAGPRRLFMGFTSSHHAVAFVHGIALIVLWSTRRNRVGFRFLVRYTLIACCVVVIVASGSRAAVVGLLLCAISTVGWRATVDRVVGITLVATVAFVMLITFVPRVSSTFNSLTSSDFRAEAADVYDGGSIDANSADDANILQRVRDWSRAVENWSSSPLIGIGAWRYDDSAVSHTGFEGIAWPVVDGRIRSSDYHAHNLYLQVLAETGLVGLALMGSLWVGLLVLIRRRYLAPHTPEQFRPWLRASWWAVVFGLGVSLTDIGLINPALTFGLGLIVATTLGATA